LPRDKAGGRLPAIIGHEFRKERTTLRGAKFNAFCSFVGDQGAGILNIRQPLSPMAAKLPRRARGKRNAGCEKCIERRTGCIPGPPPGEG